MREEMLHPINTGVTLGVSIDVRIFKDAIYQ